MQTLSFIGEKDLWFCRLNKNNNQHSCCEITKTFPAKLNFRQQDTILNYEKHFFFNVRSLIDSLVRSWRKRPNNRTKATELDVQVGDSSAIWELCGDPGATTRFKTEKEKIWWMEREKAYIFVVFLPSPKPNRIDASTSAASVSAIILNPKTSGAAVRILMWYISQFPGDKAPGLVY